MERIGDVSRDGSGELVAELERFGWSFLGAGAAEVGRIAAPAVATDLDGESVVLANGDVRDESGSMDDEACWKSEEASESAAVPARLSDDVWSSSVMANERAREDRRYGADDSIHQGAECCKRRAVSWGRGSTTRSSDTGSHAVDAGWVKST